LEEIPLTDQENAFVRSAGQYSALFPTHEDTPGFLWRSAEIYRSRYHYNEAAQRFDELVTNFPKHEYAGQAVGSMFALFFNETPARDYATAIASDKAMFNKVFHYALDNGVYLPPSAYETCFISTAHNPDVMNKAIDILSRAIKSL